MINNNTITNKWKKLIKSLHSKKHRKNNGLFLVEGEKDCRELIDSDFRKLYTVVSHEVAQNGQLKDQWKGTFVEVDGKEIAAVSSQVNNYSALSIVEIPKPPEWKEIIPGPINLFLDDVRDPGNLGTIVRTADWYGIKNVFCSNDCVDFYNPKVISSTKGSFTRIIPVYADLKQVLQYWKEHYSNIEVLGAFMEGENVHRLSLTDSTLFAMVMGNESNGIGKEMQEIVDRKISIPGEGKVESLNVAMATSILCDNLYRVTR